MPRHEIKYKGGKTAIYDGDGTWLLIDDATPDGDIIMVGYLVNIEKRFNLVRETANEKP